MNKYGFMVLRGGETAVVKMGRGENGKTRRLNHQIH